MGMPDQDNEESFLASLKEEFLNEAKGLLEECDESFLNLSREDRLNDELKRIFRIFHSLKGSGMAVGFNGIAEVAHKAENLLAILRVKPDLMTNGLQSLLLSVSDHLKRSIDRLMADKSADTGGGDLIRTVTEAINGLKKGDTSPEEAGTGAEPVANGPAQEGTSVGAKSSTVRVDLSRLEAIADLVGEITVLKGQLAEHELTRQSSDRTLASIVALFDKTVRELQEKTISLQLLPIKPVFLKLQRVVRDLSLKLGKGVSLELSGQNLELDRRIIEQIVDPLVHIARNALDHGIEGPDERIAAGKPAAATVRIAAEQVNGRVVISIADDGRGISRIKVGEKAKRLGLLAAEVDPAALTFQQVQDFLFRPGFSTAAAVTDVSGRGVGLDIVKSAVEKIKGSIALESREGRGTKFSLSFPLTTAITDGIMIRDGQTKYIVPIGSVREIVNIRDTQEVIFGAGTKMIDVRGKILPILKIDQLLFNSSDGRPPAIALILHDRDFAYSVSCEEILGQTQIVSKTLGETIQGVSGIAGGAVLSDGSLALILDPETLGRKTRALLSGGRAHVA